MITGLLIVITLLALGLVFSVIRGHAPRVDSWRAVDDALRSVDLVAFHNLTNPSDSDFLYRHLPRRDFRSVQRSRTWAALAYVRQVSANASILLRAGENARDARNAETNATANELIDLALQTRLLAFKLSLRLYTELIFPTRALSKRAADNHLLDRYSEMKESLIHLVSQQRPTMTSHISASL